MPNSAPIDDALLAATESCFTELPVHVSMYERIADETALSFWTEYSAAIRKKGSTIELDTEPYARFVSYSMPDTYPERIKTIVYIILFGFQYDDIREILEGEQGAAPPEHRANPGEHLPFLEVLSRESFAQLLLQVLDIDKERGLDLIKVYDQWLTARDNRRYHFANLDDYMSHRFDLVAARPMFATVAFGAKLESLSGAESLLVEPLLKHLGYAALLTNDYFSWEKELKTEADPLNVISYLTRESNKTSVEAKEEAKALCQKHEQAFLVEMKRLKEYGNVSPAVIAYLDAQARMVGGNCFWHATTTRYRVDKDGPRLAQGPEAIEIKEKGNPSRLELDENQYAAINIVAFEEANADEDSSLEEKRNHTMEQNGLHIMTGCCKEQDLKHLVLEVNGNGGADPPVNNSLPRDFEIMLMGSCTASETIGGHDLILAPYNYVKELPSKKVRDRFIEALNMWYQVDATSLEIISKVVSLLHDSSLLLDDIEDGSLLRRGRPSAHTVFGLSHTINSANYVFLLASAEIQRLSNKESTAIFIDEVKKIFIGQALDLYWRNNVTCPSQSEYLSMVDKKTGGLFRLAARLLQLQSNGNFNQNVLQQVITLLGWYFQIRDDYQNLRSDEYIKSKGYCEDLDEGKFSMPVVHHITCQPRDIRLLSILHRRAESGGMSNELKKCVLDLLNSSGSIEYTRNILKGLRERLIEEIKKVENITGIRNASLALLVSLLMV